MILMEKTTEDKLPGICPATDLTDESKKNNPSVLIVEDEEALSEILEFNLMRNGFKVLVAQDGLEACRMIGRDKPDLILLDIMLPLLNGWEICRMIRSHHDERISRTPVIMLSALSSEKDKLKGYDLGADLYLPKPYTVKEVILHARQLIERQKERRQLNAQLASMKKWSELQDNWQQALFHELRNQLTVISGMADHLNEGGKLPSDHSGQFIEQISNSSHYLGSLAEHYLLIRQFEDGTSRLQRESFLLQTLLDELATLFKPLADQKSCLLHFNGAGSQIVNLHPVGLKIVFSSLLENALKYSLLDGQVRLDARVVENSIQLIVSDEGPGIDEEDRDKIFDKFYRGRQQVGRTGGSGLGLYMARTLAQAMGGTLELDRGITQGCCFILTFPIETDSD